MCCFLSCTVAAVETFSQLLNIATSTVWMTKTCSRNGLLEIYERKCLLFQIIRQLPLFVLFSPSFYPGQETRARKVVTLPKMPFNMLALGH